MQAFETFQNIRFSKRKESASRVSKQFFEPYLSMAREAHTGISMPKKFHPKADEKFILLNELFDKAMQSTLLGTVYGDTAIAIN